MIAMETLDDLSDAQELARAHPGCFWAPDDADRAWLQPGDSVKICRHGERFWLTVVEIEGDLIQATVDNSLIFNLLPLGQLVQIEWRHVYQRTNLREFVSESGGRGRL
jgi:hypothetical protein